MPYRKWNGRSGQYTYHGSKYTPCWREGPITGFDYPWDATLCIYVACREADSYLYSYAIWHGRRNFINFNYVIITLHKVSTVVSIKSNNTILIFWYYHYKNYPYSLFIKVTNRIPIQFSATISEVTFWYVWSILFSIIPFVNRKLYTIISWKFCQTHLLSN